MGSGIWGGSGTRSKTGLAGSHNIVGTGGGVFELFRPVPVGQGGVSADCERRCGEASGARTTHGSNEAALGNLRFPRIRRPSLVPNRAAANCGAAAGLATPPQGGLFLFGVLNQLCALSTRRKIDCN